MPPANFKDLTDQEFDRLTVISRAPNGKGWKVRWNCECICGNTVIVSTSHLRSGHTKSCGCLNSEFSAQRATTHGMRKSDEYQTWQRMINRCYNPKNKRFERYGGRGIEICKQWKEDFVAFFNDMGKRPSRKHSIDRINNDKGYFKDNCKWSTVREQANNRGNNHPVTIDGITKTIAQWSRFTGLNRSTIFDRIKNGWSPQDTILKPKHINSKLITIDGITKTTKQWAKTMNIRPGLITQRLLRSWSPEAAVFTPLNKKAQSKTQVRLFLLWALGYL